MKPSTQKRGEPCKKKSLCNHDIQWFLKLDKNELFKKPKCENKQEMTKKPVYCMV